MDFVTLGVVSNVWATLLGTTSLEALCREAAGAGYGYVELRQGALGECEADAARTLRPQPLPDRLAALAARVPSLRYHLAVEAPFLTVGEAVDAAPFSTAVEGAAALGGDPPLLRLVDPTRSTRLLPPDGFVGSVEKVRDLARHAGARGVRLALENTAQPLSTLRQLIEIVADELEEDFLPPLLCWDAANMLSAITPEDPLAAAGSFGAEELGLFHFKQVNGGVTQWEVGEGDIDWRRILRALRDRGYRGAALFEIPAGDDAQERLERSREYVETLLREMEEA